MNDDTAVLDKIDETFNTTNDFSDEVLEAAARVDSGRAVTVGYCTTVWYCMPF
jgi:hypothetical protein